MTTFTTRPGPAAGGTMPRHSLRHSSRLTRWLSLSDGQISSEDAEEIARAECIKRGTPWWPPVQVRRHYGDWAVWTYADHKGGNVRVIVDRGTGDIKAIFGPTAR